MRLQMEYNPDVDYEPQEVTHVDEPVTSTVNTDQTGPFLIPDSDYLDNVREVNSTV